MSCGFWHDVNMMFMKVATSRAQAGLATTSYGGAGVVSAHSRRAHLAGQRRRIGTVEQGVGGHRGVVGSGIDDLPRVDRIVGGGAA